MAKKPKAEAKKIVRALTPEKDVNALLRACKGHERNISEYVGALREKLAYAVDRKNLHAPAFAVIRRLDRMEPEKLAAFLDHFNHYLDVTGLQKRAEDAPGLALQDEGDAGAGDGGEQVDDDKVSRPKFGQSGEAAADVG